MTSPRIWQDCLKAAISIFYSGTIQKNMNCIQAGNPGIPHHEITISGEFSFKRRNGRTEKPGGQQPDVIVLDYATGKK
jgi:hypothetical protein